MRNATSPLALVDMSMVCGTRNLVLAICMLYQHDEETSFKELAIGLCCRGL